MGRSLKIGQFAGIGVFVHWTFFLLVAWVAWIAYDQAAASGTAAAEQPARAVLSGVVFILALFGCVVLHEFGHALTALRYGCKTRDITLLPIGGVARLENMPEVPLQEFWVAVAGPAVNVVIAGVLFVVLVVLGQPYAFKGITLVGGAFLPKLMWVNVALVLFNMLPAFPMDGGRVLRALLATQMPRVKATRVAASVGKMMAILFGIGGLLSGDWMLLLIAVFVYIGAQAEAQAAEIRYIIKGYLAKDAMIRQFHTLTENDLIDDVARESSTSQQKDFPVTNGHQVTGLLLHRDVVKALSAGSGHHRVAEFMHSDCTAVEDDVPLDRVLDKMNANGCSTLLVEHHGDLVGILSDEQLGRWLMLHSSDHSGSVGKQQ